MKIYFDNILIDNNYYTQLKQDRVLFNEGDNFSLGSTICEKIILGIDKRVITSQPTNVRIEIDNVDYGYYIINNIEENDYEYIYTLTDKMINFNFNYSAKELIDNSVKEENGAKYVYLYEILEDMCTKANIELATITFLGSTKHISWYDNRITAREYLSYIAELNGGYAIINKSGKLELRQYTNLVKQTISTEECDNFKLGLEHKIQRVLFELNTDKWEIGEGETLYINPNNVFITSQEDINNIYTIVNNLTFYTFKVNYNPIYDVETGDCIEFKIGNKTYPTFAQYSLQYNSGWFGGYKFDIASSKQQETTIKDNTKQEIKTVRTELDRANAELKIIAEKKVDNDEIISSINVSPEEVQINSNKISLKGKKINMTSDNIKIESNNFRVDEQGNMNCNNANVQGTINSNNGNIGGWNIVDGSLNNGKNYIRANGFSNIYTYSDVMIISAYILGESWVTNSINNDPELFNFYDLNHDGAIDITDVVKMKKLISGVVTE